MELISSYFQQHTIARLILYVVIAVAILNLAKIVEVDWGIGYVDWGILAICVILVMANERWLFDCRKSKTLQPVADDEPLTPLIDDQPTIKDKLERQQYVRMLGKKIVSTYVANTCKRNKIKSDEEGIGSAYAINIEEDYGYGKTSFLMMLKDWFENHHEDQFIWIDFKPWLCDNTSSLISEFFHQLAEKISIDIDLRDDIIRYGNALASQAIKYAVGIQVQSLFHSNESSLKKQHDDIQEELNNEPQLIIVTIDDLDRLDKEEVMAVLKLIRDTADFPNIFYVTATEHTYLYNVLKSSGIEDPDRFIEKFFNLNFYLPAHEIDYREELVNYIKSTKQIWGTCQHRKEEFEALKEEPILKNSFSDLRDVKRFVNELIIYLEVLGDKDYNLYDATMAALLQYKSTELFKTLRDNDDVLLTAKANGNDIILELKNDPIAELEQQEFVRNLGNEDDNNEEEKPVKHLHEYNGKDQSYRNEILGEQILHTLFGKNTTDQEYAIKRSNNFFMYFAGREHSKSITKAEVHAIMDMNMESYQKEIDRLFEEGRFTAFLREMEYVISKDKSDVVDVIRKMFYFMSKEYQYEDKHKKRELSHYIIFVLGPQLFSVVYSLIGDSTPVAYRRTEKRTPDISPIIKEDNLIYVVSLVNIFKTNFPDFDYTRENVDLWVSIIYNRFFKENLTKKELDEDDFYMMKFFRENFFNYQDEWNKLFINYICSSEDIVKYWLTHLIIEHGERYQWNSRVRGILFGSSHDHRGKELLNALKTKFAILNPMLNNLETLLKHKDLEEISDEIKDEPFVKEYARRK